MIKGGVNRVLLATDGDFNVGITDPKALEGFVIGERDKGVELTCLGFGDDNYNDDMMQKLAQAGNGNAAFIDTINEARKVFVEQVAGTLFTIAKDVKIQIEFNPARVAEYRLIGYETRMLNRTDFNNDKVDAGEIGSGHTVTALYEITPVGSKAVTADPLRYGKHPKTSQRDRARVSEDPLQAAGEKRCPISSRGRSPTPMSCAISPVSRRTCASPQRSPAAPNFCVTIPM